MEPGSAHNSSGTVATAPATPDLERLRSLATRIKLDALEMVAIQGFGYLGQALSSAEQFAVLFGEIIRHGHDRFVLSPGHYVVAFYAAAAEVGLLGREQLADYGRDGSLLEAISTERTPGLDLTSGSLGQGLSGAIGFALADRMAGDSRRTFAFLSDGETEEGQVWEAAMFAGHHMLGHLTVVLDANGSQVDGTIASVTTIEPLSDRWRAFGWHVSEVDGHDVAALRAAFHAAVADERPSAIIARTDILGRVKAIPATADGHFLKLDPALEQAIRAELLADAAEHA
ncbi:MAG: thiamine pyrophosphate-dependent enzyme [Solirubrobacteraceae bacterium]